MVVFAIAFITMLPKCLQAELPKHLPERQFLFHVSVYQIETDGTQESVFGPCLKCEEGSEGVCFTGQEVTIAAEGKISTVRKGFSIKLQAIGAKKKRIHVGGLFEVLDPRLDPKTQKVIETLGRQCISEVVYPGEAVKVKLDLSKENGKEYRVELKVEEVKEEQRSGS
jgi:hypothetical protein